MRPALCIALTAVMMPSPLHSQVPQISQAIAAGRIGERFDGYMGFAVTPSDELRRQVTAINIQRRNLYTQLAAQRNVTAQLVGITTACTLFRQLAIGEAYLLNDQIWRHHGAGQAAPSGQYCSAN